MPDEAPVMIAILWYIKLLRKRKFSTLNNTLKKYQLKENVLKADPLLIVIVVKAVPRSACAPLLIFTFLTLLAERRQGLSEHLEFVKPDVAELIFINVALNEFRPVFDVKARGNIAVDPYGCSMRSGAAIEEPVPDFPLVFES